MIVEKNDNNAEVKRYNGEIKAPLSGYDESKALVDNCVQEAAIVGIA